MPIYSFECTSCNKKFDYKLSMLAIQPDKCTDCGGLLKRDYNKINFIRDEGKNTPGHPNYWKNNKTDDQISRVIDGTNQPY